MMSLAKRLIKRWLFLVGFILFLLGIILSLFWHLNYSKDLSFFTYGGWSPTGEKIIFASLLDNYSYSFAKFESFHVLDTHNFDFWSPDTVGFSPMWSADGENLIFLADATENSNLYLINANGTQPKKLYTCIGICEKFSWMSSTEGIWVKECYNGTCSDKGYKIIQVDTGDVIEEDVPLSGDEENISTWLFLSLLDFSPTKEAIDICPNHLALKTGRDHKESFSADMKYFAYNLPDGTFNIVETQSCKTVFSMDKNTYFKNKWWHTPRTLRYACIALGILFVLISILRASVHRQSLLDKI